MKKLDQFADSAYALLRIVAGALFLFHGAQKLFGIFGAAQPPFGSQLWFAGVIEFVGGLLIMLGLGPGSPRSSAAARWPWPMTPASYEAPTQYNEEGEDDSDFPNITNILNDVPPPSPSARGTNLPLEQTGTRPSNSRPRNYSRESSPAVHVDGRSVDLE